MHQHATKCKACDKTVYLVDQLTADEIVFHKSCLSAIIAKEPSRSMVDALSTYSSMEGVLYCKPHFEQLFKESDNFHKNFQSSVKSSDKALELCEHLPGGREVHCNAIKTRQIDSVLRATLVDFYTKCGELKSAVMLHDECQVKSSTIWSIMMWSLIQNGEFLEAVNVFERMQKSVIKPCKDALRAFVAAYTNLGALLLGRGVHNLM
ncbi:hypothetical protein ZIOFF_014299 [Zingiber officinale]|uniref:LIM zinc-binding domain-containing protein n=1 Tax=Zingiber officinale TaxID=94328 RepID=A0A8J5HDY8_ZINOF|nr:hypothetical protein ZIOFF_014299 [Zingiber officinale]